MLTEIVQSTIQACVLRGSLSSTNAIIYVGGGSDLGEKRLLSGEPVFDGSNEFQRIAPMIRPFSSPACGDTRAQQLRIGTDPVVVFGSNQTHGDSLFDDGTGTAGCADKIVGLTLSHSLVGPCLPTDACDPVTGDYIFADWKEVLAMLYGGQNHSANPQLSPAFPKTRNIGKINCASPVRKALADNWGTLFNTQCGASADPRNCVKLKHAFRYGDLDRTTNSFAALVGLIEIPPYTRTSALNFPTVDPETATPNPYCNAGVPPMNKGDADYLDLDPIRRIADSSAAALSRIGLEQIAEGYETPSNPPLVLGADIRPDPTPTAALVELPEYGASNRQNLGPDPSNPNFFVQQKAALAMRKGLGLVLPIVIPPNLTTTSFSKYLYWQSAHGLTQPPTPCSTGKFAPSLPTTPPLGICPNGDAPPCLFPVQYDPVTSLVNFNCVVTPAVPVKAPLRDNRIYNLPVLNEFGKYLADDYRNPNLTTLNPVRQARSVTGGFFRLHASQTTNFGGTPTFVGSPGTKVCQELDAKAQASCLVKANPCSIGIGTLQAVDQIPNPLNTFAYQAGRNAGEARPPNGSSVNAFLDPLAPAYYPMILKLFVNHWLDSQSPSPDPNAEDEEILYTCFKDFGGVIDTTCPNNH